MKKVLKRIVLDVLYPVRGVSIIDLAKSIIEINGINSVSITVKEVDVDTQNILVIIEGINIDYDDVRKIIEKEGGVIHSIDQVVAGEKIIEPPEYLLK
ncbi:DUF211 domain-containing protein [Desulfurococcus amylolyticus]|uniref:DUF211 domain-containing protein n=1 Tax=Desulfurococcus amylolyticus DSM 16532 TaxID=768672 RepID=I3XS31_DESAM|nr:DUF211 domain-containing protein [Desulfurococcus amylolyticus]AFL66755.1 protein of unknown function DUF211 [Desulfurococcus amylolyticus DSM 16532]